MRRQSAPAPPTRNLPVLYDGQGDERQEAALAQNVTSSRAYRGFGRQSGSSGSTNDVYAYGSQSGYRNDTGRADLLQVGARYYDAVYGVFLTRDTDLSQSPYAYCDGDPVNFADPSGHAPKEQDPKKPGDPTAEDPPPTIITPDEPNPPAASTSSEGPVIIPPAQPVTSTPVTSTPAQPSGTYNYNAGFKNGYLSSVTLGFGWKFNQNFTGTFNYTDTLSLPGQKPGNGFSIGGSGSF